MTAIILALAALSLGFFGAPFVAWVGFGAVLMWMCNFGLIGWAVYLGISAIFLVKNLRKTLISANLVKILNKMGAVPKVSETEEIALRAGTNWIETDLFSGKPDFKKMFTGQKHPATFRPD